MDPLFRDISELSHVPKFGISFHPISSLESRRAYPWVTEADSLFINVRVKISRSSAAHGQHFCLKRSFDHDRDQNDDLDRAITNASNAPGRLGIGSGKRGIGMALNLNSHQTSLKE
jgi:hypothetical protein